MPRRVRGGTSRVGRMVGPRIPRATALHRPASGAKLYLPQRQTNGVKRAPLEVTRVARLPRTQRATHAQAGPLATDRGPKQPARTGRMRRRRVAAFRAVLATSTPRGRRRLHAAHAATGATRAATRPKTRRVKPALPVSAATELGLKLVAALGNTPAVSVHRRVNYAPALVRPIRPARKTARAQHAAPGATRTATRPQTRRVKPALRVAPVVVPERKAPATQASTRRVHLHRVHLAVVTRNTVEPGRPCA